MMTGIYHMITVFLAWWIGLTFIQVKKIGVFFNSIVSAIFCGIMVAILHELHFEQFIFGAELIVFLLMMVAIQIQVRGEYGDSFIAFLIAQAVNTTLLFVGKIQTGVLIVVFGFFVYMTYRMQPYFPATNWREYYNNSASELGQMEVKIGHVYLITFFMSVISSMVWLCVDIQSMKEWLLWSLALIGIFWLGMIFLSLMNSYKKEKISLLLEQQYREEMQVFLNVIRSQRHDYNFHVQTIAGLVREGKFEECEKYVDALEKDSSLMNAVLPLHDPAISSMIHSFQVMAVKTGCELHIDIQNDLAQISTNAYETNKIISNLLQNAIDETSTHKDKSYGIWLTILKRGEYCVIRVSNKIEKIRTAEELGRIYQQGFTTKQGHDGVGLSAVRALLQRYKGTIYTQMEGDIIHFVSKIPINYTKVSLEK